MKQIRVFFAVNMSKRMKSSLKKILLLLQYKFPSRTVRWTNLDNCHITLQFLREIHYSDLHSLIEKVRSELISTPAFSLELNHLQLFPSSRHPRVIALQAGPQDCLANLAHKVGLGVSALNYPVECRPFRGHLTLGRIAYPDNSLQSIEGIELPPIPRIKVNEICLFESKASPKQQIYIPLEYFSLPTSASHSNSF